MSVRFATALAANAPLLGLKLYQAAGPKRPSGLAALWLKAIYFDSGVVRTPEQAIAKAYDSMPGIERPDFVPG